MKKSIFCFIVFMLVLATLISYSIATPNTNVKTNFAENKLTESKTDANKAKFADGKPVIETAENRPFFDLFYGMSSDSAETYYYDPLLDTVVGLNHYEFARAWHQTFENEEPSYIWFKASLGLYIDNVISEKSWRKLQPVLDKHITEYIGFDEPFDSIFGTEISIPVNNSVQFASKWENLMDRFTEYKSRENTDSVYHEVLPKRCCVVAHKIYEDNDWETFLVEVSFSIHGSSGCPSFADYYTLSKKDGHRLTNEEIRARHNVEKLEKEFNAEFLKAKQANGYEYDGADFFENLFDATGIAYVDGGVLVYYHPYEAGGGAEGQYNIIIKNSSL